MRPQHIALLLLCVVAAGCGSSQAASRPAITLHTLSGLQPPHLTVTHPAGAVAPGYVFVAEKKGGKPGGPVIADNLGRIVWYHQFASPVQATDFRTQTFRGKPVLTWWQGTINKAGVGKGYDVVYDASYRQIATVHAGHGLQADLHEFQLTPRGTAYVTIYNELPADLSGVGGPKQGWLLDSVVQEIDVASGKVVFEWHAVGHIPLADSLEANHEPALHASKKRPLDYFHVNSVADGPGGTVLISGRNTSAIYDLARDGHVVWQLGGKHGDFGPASAVKFFYQHNARLHPGGILTLFDNGGIPRAEPYTRPLVLKLDIAHRRARIVKTYVHPKKIASPFEGNLELLPGGGAFVGWGGVRKVTEFGADGRVRFELMLPFGDTYRGFRLPWSGRPSTPPAVAAANGTVYASWNGATAVARWEVVGGDDASHLSHVATAEWRGLETAITVGKLPKTVVVRALDGSGRVLGSSKPLST